MKMALLTIFTRPFRSNKPGLTTLSNSNGQAVTEYLLLMVISLTIIFGVLYKLNDAFRTFSANYFGNYIGCLLEAGELPGVNGLCESNYKPFSFANGRPLIPPVGKSPLQNSSGSSQGSGSSGSKNLDFNDNPYRTSSGNSSPRSEKTEPAISATSGSRGTGSQSFGNAGASERFASGSMKRGNFSGGDENGSSGDSGYRSFNPSSTVTATSRFDSSVGRLRYIPLDENEKKRLIEKKDTIIVTEADKKQGSRKIGGIETARKPAGEAPDIGGLTLPNFIRYILIAAIVIVIVFFLGGQALALRKSQEKS